MAFANATFPLADDRDRNEYACVGIPPGWSGMPEPRRGGAPLGTIARVLRGLFATARGPAHRGPKPEPAGR